MNSLSPFLLLILAFSCAPILLANACCPFPAFSFSTMTNVPKEEFKCSEPITVTCQFTTDEDPEDDKKVHVGIAGNVTIQEGVKVTVLKKGKGAISASLTCDTTTNLWSVNKSEKKYSNVGCVMSNTGSNWIIY